MTFPLLRLAPETVSRILSLLDISDLLHVSQTCKSLRELAVDPVLHQRRRRAVRASLLPALKARTARHELLRRGTPLISLNPHMVNQHLQNPASAHQIQAFIALKRSSTHFRLNKAIRTRVAFATLLDRGVLDEERRDGHLANSLVPAMRQLQRAQKADSLKKGMRDDRTMWRTPVNAIQQDQHVWRDSDPRVVALLVSYPCARSCRT